MIKKVLKKIERLKLEKERYVTEQSELQKKIDDIDVEMKKYISIMKDYEKLEKKFNVLSNPLEVKKSGWKR